MHVFNYHTECLRTNQPHYDVTPLLQTEISPPPRRLSSFLRLLIFPTAQGVEEVAVDQGDFFSPRSRTPPPQHRRGFDPTNRCPHHRVIHHPLCHWDLSCASIIYTRYLGCQNPDSSRVPDNLGTQLGENYLLRGNLSFRVVWSDVHGPFDVLNQIVSACTCVLFPVWCSSGLSFCETWICNMYYHSSSDLWVTGRSVGHLLLLSEVEWNHGAS